MSDRKRKCEPNLTYHTYSRCINKMKMMKFNKMKDLMIKVLNMALEKYDFELILYEVMDNHIHLLIRTKEGGASISRIMQFVKSQYARRYNWMMKRTGPFWNERFCDIIIEDQDDPENAFYNISSYILNNSVKAKYVTNAKNYKYSCINFFIDECYIHPVKL